MSDPTKKAQGWQIANDLWHMRMKNCRGPLAVMEPVTYLTNFNVTTPIKSSLCPGSGGQGMHLIATLLIFNYYSC